MLKKIKNKIYYLYFLAVLIAPSIVSAAWTPGQAIVPDCARVDSVGGCHFSDLLILINNILQVLIWLAVPISTILFAWIGWIFITSGDKATARSDAKKKLIALGTGLFFILGAWLIINTLVGLLLNPNFGDVNLLNN